MFASIVSYGLAVGAVYALIGITYNVMFSASRVFSFTAGMLGMLGGVLGALFINKMGMNAVLAFVLVMAAGAVLGVITEILTVRPVLKTLDERVPVLVGHTEQIGDDRQGEGADEPADELALAAHEIRVELGVGKVPHVRLVLLEAPRGDQPHQQSAETLEKWRWTVSS